MMRLQQTVKMPNSRLRRDATTGYMYAVGQCRVSILPPIVYKIFSLSSSVWSSAWTRSLLLASATTNRFAPSSPRSGHCATLTNLSYRLPDKLFGHQIAHKAVSRRPVKSAWYKARSGCPPEHPHDQIESTLTSFMPPAIVDMCSARICMTLPHNVHRSACDTPVFPV
jgi:hypothetical protein